MKAIVINAGATINVMHVTPARVSSSPMKLRKPMRFRTPPWTYEDDGTSMVLRKGDNHFSIYVHAKDVGVSYT